MAFLFPFNQVLGMRCSSKLNCHKRLDPCPEKRRNPDMFPVPQITHFKSSTRCGDIDSSACLAGELHHCLVSRIFSRLLTEGCCQTGVVMMPRSILSWYRLLRAHYQFPVFEAIRCALWLCR